MKNKILLLVIVFICLLVYFIGIAPNQDVLRDVQKHSQIPQRVISINPAATEIIFALGCEQKIVAVSDFCNYPKEVEKCESVGGVVNPNFERIRALDPDLIIVQGQCDSITEFCTRCEIECVNIKLGTIAEIHQNIEEIGRRLGAAESARALCKKIDNDLKNVGSKVASAKKKKVFISLYRTPGTLTGITTIGANTLLTELVAIAGGLNIFRDLQRDYPVVSKETLLKRQPEIIIEPHSQAVGKVYDANDALQDWSKLGTMQAVSNRNIFLIDSDLLLKPGPRVAQTALAIAKIIHPECFDD